MPLVAPVIRDDLCDGSFSETAALQSAGGFCAFFSGPEIPFPGNGDRKRQRLGLNAGYGEGSPSMWCRRDHPLAVRAPNLIADLNFTLHSLDPRSAVTLALLVERTTLLQFGSIGDQHGYRHC